FAKGNPGGPGNPHARRVAEIRKLLLDAVTDQDVKEICDVLVRKAKEGDLRAIKELLDRLLGRSISATEICQDLRKLEPRESHQPDTNFLSGLPPDKAEDMRRWMELIGHRGMIEIEPDGPVGRNGDGPENTDHV
ncbi:MAG: hypothetical protein ABII12_13590, partial [Planctomycetota bacterium]